MFTRVAMFALLLTGCDPQMAPADLSQSMVDGGETPDLWMPEPDLTPALHFCKLDVDTVDDGCLISP